MAGMTKLFHSYNSKENENWSNISLNTLAPILVLTYLKIILLGRVLFLFLNFLAVL